jgi:hypothetical protein
MIKAYFDESERVDGTFCVAAYCCFPAQAVKLDKRWRRIMDGRTFHATDMNCGEGEFKGLDRDLSDKMYRGLIDAILRYVEFGVVLSVNPREVTVRWPGLDGFKTAYALCCTLIVGRISSHLDSLGINSRVAYIFESGYKYQSETERFMKSIAEEDSRGTNRYHYLSHSFEGKGDATLLQTADLLAWEWCKYKSEGEHKRSMRRSLEALLLKGSKKHIVGHLSKSDLEDDLSTFREMEKVVRSITNTNSQQEEEDG